MAEDHIIATRLEASLHQRLTEIAARIDIEPQAGLVLDLGHLSADWLIVHQMARYVPERAVAEHIPRGQLRAVTGMPSFDYPAYACWRRNFDNELAREVVQLLRQASAQD